ncbi:MAG: ABC transporter ATP-binding protein [Phycisphaerales bacterium]|nr:ABC transporter ATP-binding protein [Phycisphaerales bacterium]
MILVREISKSFGSIHAVDRVSFELPQGQIAGLLGPNGAGKSTTIRMITGYLTPTTGSISIAGIGMHESPARAKAHIGYLPESAPIYPEMSVKGYLKHRAKLYGVVGRDLNNALDSAMAQTRITEVARRRVGQLSKGYKQRVGLAAALVHNPPVLILDEPTNGLDPSQIRESRSLIRELADQKTLLLCSHILPEVERTCDRVIVMAGGRVRADGTPKQLVESAPGPVLYTVEVRTNPTAGTEHALRVLATVPGVAATRAADDQPVDQAQGWSRIVLEAAPGEVDLREAIAATTEDRGLFVRELSRNTASLESLFIHLVDTANDPSYSRIDRDDKKINELSFVPGEGGS